MKTMMNIRTTMLVVMMALAGTTAFAQHRHHSHMRPYAYRPAMAIVVNRPAVTTRINNRLSKNDRMDMALAYLKSHKSLSIYKYSKMPGLPNATAEAAYVALMLVINMNISKTSPTTINDVDQAFSRLSIDDQAYLLDIHQNDVFITE